MAKRNNKPLNDAKHFVPFNLHENLTHDQLQEEINRLRTRLDSADISFTSYRSRPAHHHYFVTTQLRLAVEYCEHRQRLLRNNGSVHPQGPNTFAINTQRSINFVSQHSLQPGFDVGYREGFWFGVHAGVYSQHQTHNHDQLNPRRRSSLNPHAPSFRPTGFAVSASSDSPLASQSQQDNQQLQPRSPFAATDSTASGAGLGLLMPSPNGSGSNNRASSRTYGAMDLVDEVPVTLSRALPNGMVLDYPDGTWQDAIEHQTMFTGDPTMMSSPNPHIFNTSPPASTTTVDEYQSQNGIAQNVNTTGPPLPSSLLPEQYEDSPPFFDQHLPADPRDQLAQIGFAHIDSDGDMQEDELEYTVLSGGEQYRGGTPSLAHEVEMTDQFAETSEDEGTMNGDVLNSDGVYI